MTENGGMSERQRSAYEHFMAQEDQVANAATQPASGPPAGWYPDPGMADTRRYWDGSKWSDHVAPGLPASVVPLAAREPDLGGLIVAGYVTAVLLPLVGFIIGIVLLAKGRSDHGAGAMVLSVVAFLFWLGLMANASSPEPAYFGLGLRS